MKKLDSFLFIFRFKGRWIEPWKYLERKKKKKKRYKKVFEYEITKQSIVRLSLNEIREIEASHHNQTKATSQTMQNNHMKKKKKSMMINNNWWT